MTPISNGRTNAAVTFMAIHHSSSRVPVSREFWMALSASQPVAGPGRPFTAPEAFDTKGRGSLDRRIRSLR